MFCPRCSQQQFSDNVRFCSRCGFQLNVVKALLGADDSSLSKTSEFTLAVDRSRRKKDMATGALLMMFFALHTAWTTEDLSLDREYTSLIFKCFILCVMINIMPAIRNFFSGKTTRDAASSPKMFSRLTAKFKNKNQNSALPAAFVGPTADYFTGRITTADFIPQPPSVTEDTTKLFRNN